MTDSPPHSRPAHQPARHALPVICDVDRDDASRVLELLIAAGMRYAMKADVARRSVVFAWEHSDRQAQPSALSSAHSRVRAQVWTTRLTRTPYALYVTSTADADDQLDGLSEVLGRRRETWTIKPPRGWSGYGWPRRDADSCLDESIDKPWGREHRVYDDALTDLWLVTLDRDRARSRHSHPRKDTALLCVQGDGVVKVADGDSDHTSAAAPGLTLVEMETPRDKYDLVRVTRAAAGAGARLRSRTTPGSAWRAPAWRRARRQQHRPRAHAARERRLDNNGLSNPPSAAVGATK